eukprot:jgi/Chlat1/4847/Chrsp31S04808
MGIKRGSGFQCTSPACPERNSCGFDFGCNCGTCQEGSIYYADPERNMQQLLPQVLQLRPQCSSTAHPAAATTTGYVAGTPSPERVFATARVPHSTRTMGRTHPTAASDCSWPYKPNKEVTCCKYKRQR